MRNRGLSKLKFLLSKMIWISSELPTHSSTTDTMHKTPITLLARAILGNATCKLRLCVRPHHVYLRLVAETLRSSAIICAVSPLVDDPAKTDPLSDLPSGRCCRTKLPVATL